MEIEPHSLREVLAIAKIHPFYAKGIRYPPDEKTIQEIRETLAKQEGDDGLKLWPVAWKNDL